MMIVTIDKNPEKLKLWYNLFRTILMEGIEKFPKTPRLHLLYAFIQHERLGNKYKALSELMITEENKPNIQEEFSIYRYK